MKSGEKLEKKVGKRIGEKLEKVGKSEKKSGKSCEKWRRVGFMWLNVVL